MFSLNQCRHSAAAVPLFQFRHNTFPDSNVPKKMTLSAPKATPPLAVCLSSAVRLILFVFRDVNGAELGSDIYPSGVDGFTAHPDTFPFHPSLTLSPPPSSSIIHAPMYLINWASDWPALPTSFMNHRPLGGIGCGRFRPEAVSPSGFGKVE